MAVLFLVDDIDRNIFTFSPLSDGTWYFSRVSKFHHENQKDRFVLRQAPQDGGIRWAVEDLTGGKAKIIGTPKESGNGPMHQGRPSPMRGRWKLWGCPFTLTDDMPRYEALECPFSAEVPFATMQYREEGTVAWLQVTMRSGPITDETLEELLDVMRKILTNLARRPEMVLLIRSDGRGTSSSPAWKHVRRFLAFIQQEVGTETVLVGRGSAIILVPSGLLSRALIGIVQFVQRILPAPYPQTIVSSTEEADLFLAELAKESREASAAMLRTAAAQAEANAEADSCFTPRVSSRENDPSGAAAAVEPSEGRSDASLPRRNVVAEAAAVWKTEVAAVVGDPPIIEPLLASAEHEQNTPTMVLRGDELEGLQMPAHRSSWFFCSC